MSTLSILSTLSTLNRKLPKWLVILWLMSGLNVAAADPLRQTRPYAGGGVIALNLYDRTCDQPVRSRGDFSFTVVYRCGPDREINYNVFAGFQFNRHWSAELGYVQADGFDYTGDGTYQARPRIPSGQATDSSL